MGQMLIFGLVLVTGSSGWATSYKVIEISRSSSLELIMHVRSVLGISSRRYKRRESENDFGFGISGREFCENKQKKRLKCFRYYADITYKHATKFFQVGRLGLLDWYRTCFINALSFRK